MRTNETAINENEQDCNERDWNERGVLSFKSKGSSYLINKPIEVKRLKTIFDKIYQDFTKLNLTTYILLDYIF